jgi:hypothetical protein
MFKVIEYVYFATDGLGCYYFVRLRHLSCSIDFALMIDLHLYLNALLLIVFAHYFCRLGLWVVIKAGVKLSGIFGGLQGYFDFDDLDVVLLVVAGVRAD